MRSKTLLLTLTSFLLLTLVACADQPAQQEKAYGSISVVSSEPAPSTPVTPAPQMPKDTSPQTAAPVAGDTVAVIETDMGTIKFKLFTKQVPEMSKNFEELAKAGNYSNVPFHRVIKDFMIQTGDFTKKNGQGGHSYKGPNTELPDEIVPSLKHLFGTVAMANSGPDTNGSQFYIVTNKNGTPMLNGGYTIFGQVYEGMDVAEKIADLYIPSSGGTGTPSKIVNMTKVTVMPYAP